MRIARRTHRRLKEIAIAADQPLTQVLDDALDAYRRQRFLEDANAAYAKLRRNAAQWRREVRERGAWDATLADGLEKS